MQYLGEFYAFLTAIGWAASSIFFEAASKKSNSLTVNVVRLILGIIFLGMVTFLSRGLFFPTDSTRVNWTFLGISGIIGFFLGDMFLYEAYILIGARISMVFMTMAPLIVGLLSYIFLGERLSFIQILAMVVTCSGILLVIVKPKTDEDYHSKKLSIKGIIFASMAVFFESLGNIFTKIGS
jgi:Predicted membrane protein